MSLALSSPPVLSAIERLCQAERMVPPTTEHLVACGYCLRCTAVLDPSDGYWEPAQPTYALRFIARCWPEIEWLAFLPRAERLWYAQHADALKRRFPDVTGDAWDRLFP